MTVVAFPRKARRADSQGHMIIQDNLDRIAGSVDVGTTTVLVGQTSVNVNHGLGTSLIVVMVMPTLDPVARYWVSAKSATQFTITMSAAAPGGGIPFDWIARKLNV